jgi:hypothetical protein
VFSLVVRDLLVSFASGFANSTVASPIPGKTYGTMTSAQWSSSAAKLFAEGSADRNLYNPLGCGGLQHLRQQPDLASYSDYFTR